MYVCMYVHTGGICMLCINGKQAANVSEARKRQRRHNVSYLIHITVINFKYYNIANYVRMYNI